MKKAIIWDLDGVILDSEKYHANIEIATMKKFGADLTEEIVREYTGTTVKHYFEALVKRFHLDVDPQVIMKRHEELLKKYYAELFPMVPHADTVLKAFSGKYKMAVGTSAIRREAQSALKRFDLLQYFEALVCGDEVVNGKPDPEVFLKAAEKLGVKPSECVVVEDAELGMYAAKDAGMKVIVRKAGHNRHKDFSKADYVVTDLLDILKILK